MAQVFLVDRNERVRHALRLALEAGGHRVTEASEGADALSLLRLATGPRIVLVEYTALWSDGADFVRAVAADPILAGRHVYLLMTSDRPAPLIVINPEVGLPLPVLLKPFDPDTLLTLVGRAAASITPTMGIRGAWHRKRETRLGRWDGGLHVGTSKRSAAKQSGQQHLQLPTLRLSNDVKGTTGAPRVGAIQTAGGRAMHGEKHEKQSKEIDTMDGAAAGNQLEATGQASTGQAIQDRKEHHARVESRAGSNDLMEKRYAQGMAAGRTAAAADAPDFSPNDDVLQMAWDVSDAATTEFLLAEQEDYCVGWARGYTHCAGEIEGEAINGDEIQGVPDSWEDDGGRVA